MVDFVLRAWNLDGEAAFDESVADIVRQRIFSEARFTWTCPVRFGSGDENGLFFGIEGVHGENLAQSSVFVFLQRLRPHDEKCRQRARLKRRQEMPAKIYESLVGNLHLRQEDFDTSSSRVLFERRRVIAWRGTYVSAGVHRFHRFL